MTAPQTRKKDRPGEPRGNGTGGSFAGDSWDADTLNLSADQLTETPDAALEALLAASNTARKRLEIASAKVIATETRNKIPEAAYLLVEMIERRDGEFAGYYPRSVHKLGGERIADLDSDDVALYQGIEIGMSPAFREALKHIPRTPPFQWVDGSGERELVEDRDYNWLTPSGHGQRIIAFGDALNADLP